MAESIASAKAITAFSIASGVATGLATIYLSSKHADNKLDSRSVATAVGVAVLASLGAAFLMTKA